MSLNYIYVLTSSSFHTVNLDHLKNTKVNSPKSLDQISEQSLYFEKEEQVEFTQTAGDGLQAFEISFVSKVGNISTVCPVIPKTKTVLTQTQF